MRHLQLRIYTKFIVLLTGLASSNIMQKRGSILVLHKTVEGQYVLLCRFSSLLVESESSVRPDTETVVKHSKELLVNLFLEISPSRGSVQP